MAQHVRSVVKILSIGIFAWVIGGIIAFAINADSKIIWTCLTGALLGILGVIYTVRRAGKNGI